MKELKYALGAIGLVILGLWFVYPPDLFIPEGWWPIIPTIFLHYPLSWTLSSLTPFILFMGLIMVVGMLFHGVIKA